MSEPGDPGLTDVLTGGTDGAWLRFPRMGTALPAAELKPINVGALPGAAIADRVGGASDTHRWEAACVRGPSDRWAPGAVELLFERATHLAVTSFGEPVGALRHEAMRALDGPSYRQRFATDEGPRAFVGEHVLAFAGDEADVVVCAVVCAGPPDDEQCTQLLDGLELVGQTVAEPPPSLVTRLVFASAEQPRTAFAIAAALACVLVVVILRRRPRPRP